MCKNKYPPIACIHVIYYTIPTAHPALCTVHVKVVLLRLAWFKRITVTNIYCMDRWMYGVSISLSYIVISLEAVAVKRGVGK